MSKLIKHEFRATARIMLPLLLAAVVSSLVFSLIQKFDNLPGAVTVLSAMICTLTIMATGVMCLVVMIERFYRNTMADTAYLTMTLPVSTHEFVSAEIINDIIWLFIVSVALLAAFFGSLTLLDMISLPDSMKELAGAIRMFNEELAERNIGVGRVWLIGTEAVICGLLAFTAFCQRFYAAMAVGQLSSKHRGLLAVLAYIVIGWILFGVSVLSVNILGKNIYFSAAENPGSVIKLMGIADYVALLVNAVLYFPTILILKKKLNLQ